MGELRKDPATDEWVILAPARASRPRASKPPAPEAEAAAPHPTVQPDCPFCPGNEHRTPPTIAREPEDEGTRWQVRVFANLFPVVEELGADSPDGTGGEPPNAGAGAGVDPLGERAAAGPSGEREGDGPGQGTGERAQLAALWVSRPAVGAHEVIVDSPDHAATFADMSVAHLAAVLRVYRDRMAALARRPGVEYVALFRNEGRGAGASQPHPHGQIIALPLVPGAVARRWAVAAAYRRRHGGCLYCHLTEWERETGRRWLGQNDDAAAFCAFAPRYPFETWIVPRRHRPSFGETPDEELRGVAAMLRAVLRALRREVGAPPYNVLFHTGRPLGGGDFHWHVQIAPRLATWAGFELGTGIAVTAQSPEEAATRLREAMTALEGPVTPGDASRS